MSDFLAPDQVPIGSIVEWSGTLATIPTDYALCDGTNGTPDLHALFLRGAPASTEAGTTGGEDSHQLILAEIPSHTHSFSNTGHTHTYLGYSTNNPSNSGGIRETTGASNNMPTATSGLTINNAGGDVAHENRPAFYELAYIMRMT